MIREADAKKTPEEQWEAAWENDENLRAEYGDQKSTYLAYMKNKALADASILKRG